MVSLGTVVKSAIAGLVFSTSALADVKLGNMQSSYSASSTMSITWTDDGSSPPLSDLTTAEILLCTGPNANIHCFSADLATGVQVSAEKYNVQLADIASLGTNGPYYLQFVSTYKGGGQTIHYSDRFDLTSMTGSYKASDGGDTTPPPAQNQIKQSVPSSLGSVPYTQQTGKTRMAPMQMQPGTSVNLNKKVTPLFPTSAVTYFSTISPSPSVLTTLTPGWSYTFSAWTNMVATRALPTGAYPASKPGLANFTMSHAPYSTGGSKQKS